MFSMLGKHSADNIWNIFLTFTRKQYLTFHANCLLTWKQGLTFHANCQFARNFKSCFPGKIKMLSICCLLLAHSVVKVKQTKYTWKISAFFFCKTDNFCDFLFAFLLYEIDLDLTAWCSDWSGSVMFTFLIKYFLCMPKKVTIVVSIWSMWHSASKQVHLWQVIWWFTT